MRLSTLFILTGKKGHRSTKYRKKLKEQHPEKYQEYLKKQRERSKKSRESLKKQLAKKKPPKDATEKKKHQLAQQRLRQAKYMENRIENTLATPKRGKAVKTRHNVQSRKEYNREMQSLCRSKMSSQKRNWIKKKDRQRKSLKRKIEREKTVPEILQEPQNSNEVTEKLVDEIKSTPLGRAAVIRAARNLTKKYSKTYLGKQFKINRRTLSKKERAKRRKTFNTRRIKEYYTRSDISRVMPQRRYATKDGPGFLLLMSIKEVYQKYKKEYKSEVVSFSTFACIRPKNVRLLTSSHREYCMCVYCMNIRNKLLCLEHAKPSAGPKQISEINLFEMILCPKPSNQKFFSVACIESTCSKCIDYGSTLETIYKNIPENKQLCWNRWQRGDKKTELVAKSGTRKDLLKELVEIDILKPSQGTTFLRHLHTAQWQLEQFSFIKENLPQGWILQVMDFAKNRSISYQEEIKAAFFSNGQITIHPIVNYYHKTGQQCLVKEACIVISDDLSHDYHAVEYMKSVVDKHITSQIGAAPEKKVVYSDGCAAQYKSKGPFADLSLCQSAVSRNYFGSEHGKSACDAEIGVLNRSIDRAIIGKRVIINSPEDLFEFCQAKLTLDDPVSKRTFIYVRSKEISRDRPETMIKPVASTRKFHNIENTTEPYKIKVRHKSCFCTECLKGSQEACLNSEYVSTFEIKTLVPTKKDSTVTKDKKETILNTEFEDKENINIEKPCFSNKKNTAESKRKVMMKDNSDAGGIRKFISVNKVSKILKENKNEAEVVQETTVDNNDEAYKYIVACKNFLELEMLSDQLQIPPISDKPLEVTIVTHKKVIDKASLPLVPDEDDLNGLFPCLIYGDGNCLPRCGSLYKYGTEDKHLEIRASIVLELVQHKELYLNMNIEAKMFAMFSEFYTGEVLTALAIRRIYEKEVFSVRKAGSYMGVWQLSALANVLGRPVRSVYPVYGGQTVRKDLNRTFLPYTALEQSHPPVYVMWTNLRGNAIPEIQWKPNHFVAMLPIEPASQSNAVEVEDKLEDISGVSSLLEEVTYSFVRYMYFVDLLA